MKKKIEFIQKVVKEIGFALLSSQCKRYHGIYYDANADKFNVIAFTRNGGKEILDLSNINSKAITAIYNDLMEDFNEI